MSKRRKFIRQIFLGLTGAATIGGFYSWQIEPFWLEFVRVRMPIQNLPNDLAGKTLMQISDIHIGKRFDYHFVIDSLKKAAEFHPDFVVYTGDYVSTYKDEVQYNYLEEVLGHLVKGNIGTIAILGNHDYGKNWSQHEVAEKITRMLVQNGVPVLRNQNKMVGGLNFIGFDDYWGLNFNPTMAMSGFDRTKANIVLCHNPDVCDIDIWGDYNSWILAGHTHGGQVKPPFLPPPMLPVKNRTYSSGTIPLSNNRMLYVNRALGHLWQVRFNVRPEITIFELQQA